MSSPRLRAQFETLFEHFNGKDTGIQLDDITEILFCTRRNARIVLNKLAEEGWIEWHPAAGRGNLSQLIFKRNRRDVSENLAKRYLEEGKIGQALTVLDRDAGKLTQVIQDYLGVQHLEGEQVIRLPYYRPLSMLNPTKPHRRSEQHIISQIFSGLTKLDENDQIQPDLAHTWEAIAGNKWRFYLRRGVRFHNGNILQTEHVIESLCSLKEHKLFSHIESVVSPMPWVIDINLVSDDWHLPLILSEVSAKIIPPKTWQLDNFDLMPIGTGPYKVEVNNDKRLILEAYDGYFGYRPLIDNVEVWVIDEAYSTLVFPSLSNPIKPQNTVNQDVELDPGCTYLLMNRRNGVLQDPQWARYISNTLNSFNLFRALPEQTIVDMGLLPAHGLKPGWHHSLSGYKKLSPPGKEKLTIAYHGQHPIFPALAKSIEKVLSADGISVEFVKYSYKVDKTDNIDLWMKPMGLGTNRDDALAGWLLGHSDIERMSDKQSFSQWHELIEAWRREKDTAFPAKELGRLLVESNQIVPMFHCWLGVSKDHCGTLQNAKCNALGWFDFSEVWVKPEIDNHS
ncbi:SgrR family transcriptional regulator [Vibrio sp. JC009]|uniref:SgrR family transcriptional regulator n=1 Tax=Vibrio sp. JC009 TaxID=2912314 RepID=UPI0023B1D086|nr:SgrR family transcriptional regulator [Vibrio sp. JC009]WED24420.1 SgrR family transcriptional regulator [Vibrio sp. JC009]